MQPTPSDVHVNAPLTQISIAYLQDTARDYIADRVFPGVPVLKDSDRYFEFKRGNWFRTEAKPRPLSSESAGSGFEIDSTPSYTVNVQALHKDIDDRLRANQDEPLDLDAAASEFVARGLMLRREKDWATNFFTTSVWTGSTTGGDITPGTLWDVGGSTPITDIRTQITSVHKKTGMKPNFLVLAKDVWSKLQDNADFTNRISIGRDKIVTTDLLAAVLELDNVYIASAVENTATEGATDSFAFVYTRDALVGYAAPRPSLMHPSAGYTFNWTGYLGAAPNGMRMMRFRIDEKRSDRVEGEVAYAMKVISSDLAVFFNNTIS